MMIRFAPNSLRRLAAWLIGLIVLCSVAGCQEHSPQQMPVTEPGASETKPLIGCLAAVGPLRPNDAELFAAAQSGDLLSAERSISAGANIAARDALGRSPLFVAAMCDRLAIAKLLITHGTDINAQDFMGMAPLHAAVVDGWAALAEFLIARGANVNLRDADGRTPLHLAAATDQAQMVTLIMTKGGDNMIIDRRGFTAATLASRNGHMAVAAKIKEWRQNAPRSP